MKKLNPLCIYEREKLWVRESEREWKTRSKRDTEADGVTEHPEKKWQIISELLSISNVVINQSSVKKRKKTHQHGVQWYEVQSTHPLSLNHGYLYSKALKSPLIVSRDQFTKISMLLLLESRATMLSCLWWLGHPQRSESRENPQSLPKDAPQASYRHQTSLTTCGLSFSDNERDPSMFQCTESASKRPLKWVKPILFNSDYTLKVSLACGG